MIDTPIFCKALKFAAHAAAKKDVRYYLKGVRFEVVDQALTLCGLDGARMALCCARSAFTSTGLPTCRWSFSLRGLEVRP